MASIVLNNKIFINSDKSTDTVDYLKTHLSKRDLSTISLYKPMDFISKLFQYIASYFDSSIKGKIDNLVISINREIEHNPRGIENKEYKEKITHLFFDVLSNFDEKQFNRNLISEKLKTKLLEVITEQSDELPEVRLAMRLGIKPTINKGDFSSSMCRNLSNKYVGIFKPAMKNFVFKPTTRLKKNLCKLLGIKNQDFFLPFNKDRSIGCMLSERASYKVSKHLGLDLVPKTNIVNISGKIGSYQHFVEGYQEAAEATFPQFPNQKDYEKFQVFALFDYVLGNLDRKSDNWLVKMNKDGHIDGIAMIDNANCFTKDYLVETNIFASHNQHAWKNMPLSNTKLTAKAAKFIDSLTDKEIDKIIDTWKKDLPKEYVNNFITPEVIRLFKERAAVLRKAKNEDLSLKEIGEIRTEKTIKGFLNGEVIDQPMEKSRVG